MAAENRGTWRPSIRTKILLPSIALFAIFAVVVVVGVTRLYTESVEHELVERLDRSGALMDAIFLEEESRTALHARFTADMVRLAEQFSENSTGRSALVYLLEYLGQAGVDIHIYSTAGQSKGPYESLVRKGELGIRATMLVMDAAPDGAGLGIASGAPIDRTGGIREVAIGVYRMTDERFEEFKAKLGVDVTLVRDGDVLGSTLDDDECLREIREAISDEAERRVLEEGDRFFRTLECGSDPKKMLFRPVEVGFRHEAVEVLAVSVQDLRAARTRIGRGTLVVAGLVLLVALGIHSALIRRITQPIGDLVAMTRRVASRDFDTRVAVRTTDEIGVLGDSYNAMIARLAKSQREIEQLHQRELERTHRLASIGELASGIAHEVRNPLAGISGAMQVLQHDEALGGDRKEILDEILHQIRRLEKLTRDLLEYSRPSVPQLQPGDLHEILDKAVFLGSMGLTGENISVERNYEENLPRVRIDPEQIQQVFLNVLINAFQALPDGGTIRIGTRRIADDTGDRIVVEIEDDGTGMVQETRDRAVRPFFTTKHQGTGLGLSIVRQIMRDHSGTLRIDSEPGKGTLVSLQFPADPTSVDGDARTPGT